MQRRVFLKSAAIGGGGLILAAGGWRTHQAGLIARDSAPFEPWDALSRAQKGDPAALAAAAILASNPHNSQPWRLSVSDDRFVIEADTARHIGAVDPFRREMWIGLGAAIGNAQVAAPGFGFAASEPRIEGLGEGGAGRITLDLARSDQATEPLAAAITKRRTNRTPFQPDPVNAAALSQTRAHMGRVSGARLVLIERESRSGQDFASGTVEATAAINADAAMTEDTHLWFRGTMRETAEHRDGVAVHTAGLSPIMTVMAQILPQPDAEAAGVYWLASTEKQVAGAAGYGLLVIDGYDNRAAQIAAGRLWQRLHLAFTLEGLAAQPLNQMPEMVGRDQALGRDRGWRGRLEAIAGGTGAVAMAFRYGVPIQEVAHSARRPLEWVMGDARPR